VLSFCFSSRSRHTRFSRDWSSDVCSSDLLITVPVRPLPKALRGCHRAISLCQQVYCLLVAACCLKRTNRLQVLRRLPLHKATTGVCVDGQRVLRQSSNDGRAPVSARYDHHTHSGLRGCRLLLAITAR